MISPSRDNTHYKSIPKLFKQRYYTPSRGPDNRLDLKTRIRKAHRIRQAKNVRRMYLRPCCSFFVLTTNTFTFLQFTPTNPKPFLGELVKKPIVVTLKFNKTQYKGILISTDNYFNVQLSEAEEFIDGKNKGKVGDIFIRCNNVLWIGEDLSAKEQHQEKPAIDDNAPATTD